MRSRPLRVRQSPLNLRVMKQSDPAPPRAFATADAQSREQLARQPLRSLLPSVLRRAVSGLPGVGPAAAKRLAEGAEVVTCIAGEGAPLGADEIGAISRRAAPQVEVESLDGGQAHYWWLLAAE